MKCGGPPGRGAVADADDPLAGRAGCAAASKPASGEAARESCAGFVEADADVVRRGLPATRGAPSTSVPFVVEHPGLRAHDLGRSGDASVFAAERISTRTPARRLVDAAKDFRGPPARHGSRYAEVEYSAGGQGRSAAGPGSPPGARLPPARRGRVLGRGSRRSADLFADVLPWAQAAGLLQDAPLTSICWREKSSPSSRRTSLAVA